MNSPVCVDANLIVWTLVPAPLSDKAEALLERWWQKQVTFIAPALFAFEATSSLRRLVYLHVIGPAEGEQAFETFLELDICLSR
jgi:predicted nucleic acid-binding protein